MDTNGIIIILGIYVDDGLFCSNSEDATKKILDYLEEHFDLGRRGELFRWTSDWARCCQQYIEDTPKILFRKDIKKI